MKMDTRLKQVYVFVEFDENLKELTGLSRREISVSEGTPFFMFLQAILENFPQIANTFDFSSIHVMLNGVIPKLNDSLHAYDIISMMISQTYPFQYDHATFDHYSH